MLCFCDCGMALGFLTMKTGTARSVDICFSSCEKKKSLSICVSTLMKLTEHIEGPYRLSV